MAEYMAREVLLAQLRAMESYNVSPMYRRGYDDCVATVLNAPTADVAPVVHGRWEVIHVQNHWDKARCSACKRLFESYEWGSNYCPVCGAKMDGGADNETD